MNNLSDAEYKKSVGVERRVADVLKGLIQDLWREDEFARRQLIRECRRNEEYWKGVQNIYWSDQFGDWRIPTHADLMGVEENDRAGGGIFYDYIVNIYRAHGESIIAAISQSVPSVSFPPDDADDENDIFTAKNYGKLAKLIHRHNKVKLLWFHALFVMYNDGTVFAYNHHESDPSFGKTNIPKFANLQRKTTPDTIACPNCNARVDIPPPDPNDFAANFELKPEDLAQEPWVDSSKECNNCGHSTGLIVTPGKISNVDVAIGTETVDKSREIIDIYSPLYVKCPIYSKDISGCGYLFLSEEQSFALLKDKFPDFREDISPSKSDISDGYDRYARSPILTAQNPLLSTEFSSMITFNRCWIRNWQFEAIKDGKDTEVVDELKKLFPEGCRVELVGDLVVLVKAESLDARWSACNPDIYPKIYGQPVGNGVVQMQDIKNTLTNLSVETVEHGIPAAFADPEVVDFDRYAKQEARPGYITPIKGKPSGEPLGNSFFTNPMPSLSSEALALSKQTDSDAQFVSGDVPALYGGASQGKSRTLGEYMQSRNNAMQRLSIVWQKMNVWWGSLSKKAVESFLRNSVESQINFTDKDGPNFIKVALVKEEMIGAIGDVEVESSDTIPASIGQIQDTLLKLLALNQPDITSALLNSDNQELLFETLGIEDLHLPGLEQRLKQLRENLELSKASPAQQPGGVLVPSVGIDQDLDDHLIHMQTIRTSLVSQFGQELRELNANGYNNMMAHYRAHLAALQQQQQEQQQAQQQQGAPQSPSTNLATVTR